MGSAGEGTVVLAATVRGRAAQFFSRGCAVLALCGLPAVAWAQGTAPAAFEPALEVLDTDPGTNATLGRQDSFYIRFRVTAPVAVTVQVRAAYQGKPVPVGNAGLRRLPPGGSTDATFFFPAGGGAGRVDEAQLIVTEDAAPKRTRVFVLPVDLAFTGPSQQRAVAPWVTQWRAGEEQRRKEEYEAYSRRLNAAGGGWLDTVLWIVLPLIVLVLPLAGLALPVWCAWKWRGRWRTLAAVAVAVFWLKVLSIVIDGVRDPTSHNLWPLELLFWEAGVLVYLLAVYVMRRGALRAEAGS